MNIFPEPRLASKVGFYLTDLSAPGCGQTYIVPRSHLQNDLRELETRASRRNLRPSASPEQLGAVPLLVEPGTAVIYDGRVVHSVRSRNASAVTRKAMFFYSTRSGGCVPSTR